MQLLCISHLMNNLLILIDTSIRFFDLIASFILLVMKDPFATKKSKSEFYISGLILIWSG
uniref:Uncharacterized protein n=1 Tax=Arundo donax TaxID=35708 RepID=A0A0A9CH17_ARUDO